MPPPDRDQVEICLEKEAKVQQLIAFAAGIFQGDVTLRSILESLADGVVVIDSSGTILLVNDRIEDMFGYQKHELIGNPHSVLLPERFRDIHEEHVARYFREPRFGQMTTLHDVAGLRRDGSEIPVDISLGPMVDGLFALALVSDISLRKQAERAMHQSEELFHIQVECVNDYAIVMLDAKGNVLNWNVGAEHFKGYRAEEIIGKHFSCFYTEEDRDAGKPAESLEKAAGKGRLEECGWRLRRDGSRFWADVILTAIHDDNGQLWGFSHVTRDVTERKLAEDALRESEELLRITIGNMVDPVFITDDEGRFTFICANVRAVLGCSEEEIKSLGTISRLFGKELFALEELKTRGHLPNIESAMVKKDGSRREFLTTVKRVSIKGGTVLYVCHDVTERKAAEDALRASEARFRLIADSAPAMIWEAGEDGASTFFNRQWLEYTGRSLEQELGYGWTDGVQPDDYERCMETYRSAFRERRGFSVEYRLRRADGDYGWICDTGVPLMAEGGELLGYIGSCYDITERKQAGDALQQDKALLEEMVAERTADLDETIESLHKEINERIRIGEVLQAETTERLNAQAELREKELIMLHQSRLAAMGEMIDNIAHQWRQPLNILSLIAQELPLVYNAGTFSIDYLKDKVVKMLEKIEHMSQTIDDFRNFFRIDKEKVDFKVLEMMNKTISLLQESFAANEINIIVVPTCDPVLNGYPNEISHVLLNILSNARDAFVEQKVTSPTITIEIGTNGEKCVVTISDNAGGIPEEIIDKIFDPYFTTKGADKGTGVGLYISKTIIEKNLGGSLSARNVNGGAQFRIVL